MVAQLLDIAVTATETGRQWQRNGPCADIDASAEQSREFRRCFRDQSHTVALCDTACRHAPGHCQRILAHLGIRIDAVQLAAHVVKVQPFLATARRNRSLRRKSQSPRGGAQAHNHSQSVGRVWFICLVNKPVIYVPVGTPQAVKTSPSCSCCTVGHCSLYNECGTNMANASLSCHAKLTGKRRERRPPKPLDAVRMEELALAYVARFATSAAKVKTYLNRKLRRARVRR